MNVKLNVAWIRNLTSHPAGRMVRLGVCFALVALIHGVIIGGLAGIQGCRSTTPQQNTTVEPPPAPDMPPVPAAPVVKKPTPTFRPPVVVETAPTRKEVGSMETYVVAKGDSLSTIAKRFGVSARELADLNQIKDFNKIRLGQKLILPAYAHAVKPLPVADHKPPAGPKAPAVAPLTVGAGGAYVVQPGDALEKIARKQGTTVKALREANKLSGDTIRVGQKLVIPGASAAAPTMATAPVTPAVPQVPAVAPVAPPVGTVGDVPAPVVTATEIVAVEEVSMAKPLPPEKAFQYTVAEEDTLGSVAMTFAVLKEDIMKANNLTEDVPLKPGQKLVIPLSAP